MPEPGLVVARHRKHVVVETRSRERILCRTVKRSLQPLVGDEVEWTRAGDGAGGGSGAGSGTGSAAEGGIVTAIAPRRSSLSRIDSRGRCELVAANLTALLAVAAPSPAPDWVVVDHYLVAAELGALEGAVVLNKADLLDSPPRHLDCYRRAGYAIHLTSTLHGRRGLVGLAAALASERSVLVGQSGVGKSSLLNALVGDVSQSVGTLTAKGQQGRHTTSSTMLYRLANGGELIDSPGVRNFAPYIAEPADLQHGFREFKGLLGRCRFDDCRHLAEPGCAVKAALEHGTICRRRYASYERLYALVDSFRGPGKRPPQPS